MTQAEANARRRVEADRRWSARARETQADANVRRRDEANRRWSARARERQASGWEVLPVHRTPCSHTSQKHLHLPSLSRSAAEQGGPVLLLSRWKSQAPSSATAALWLADTLRKANIPEGQPQVQCTVQFHGNGGYRRRGFCAGRSAKLC